MSIRSLPSCRMILVALAAMVLMGCSSAPRPAASAPAVRTDVSFACLWWSEAQMEGLNPNAPPPKTTEVKLTKWEYSDPVGVPHPDTVDVVVKLTNTGRRAVSNLEVRVAGEWKDGPLKDAASAVWSQTALLQEFRGVSVAPAAAQTLRVPVDLKAVMDSLAKHQQWPYGLRATVTVGVPGSAQPLLQAVAELPIRPGD